MNGSMLMYLRIKLGRNSRSRTVLWSAKWEMGALFSENKSWKLQSSYCWGHTQSILSSYEDIWCFVHFLLCESGCLIAGFVWSDIFPSMSQPGSTVWILLCVQAPGAPLCQQGEIHIITGLAIAKLYLIIITGINIKADTFWVQMSVQTSWVSQ